MTKILSKPNNYQNTKNERNTPKTDKIAKIPIKPKNYQNTLEVQKMTKMIKILSKPKR